MLHVRLIKISLFILSLFTTNTTQAQDLNTGGLKDEKENPVTWYIAVRSAGAMI